MEVVFSCRICRIYDQDGDFECLFSSTDGTLSEAGKLYEELLGIQINLDGVLQYYPQYLCNSCDLQMRLFKKLKTNANKTLAALEQEYASLALLNLKKHDSQGIDLEPKIECAVEIKSDLEASEDMCEEQFLEELDDEVDQNTNTNAPHPTDENIPEEKLFDVYVDSHSSVDNYSELEEYINVPAEAQTEGEVLTTYKTEDYEISIMEANNKSNSQDIDLVEQDNDNSDGGTIYTDVYHLDDVSDGYLSSEKPEETKPERRVKNKLRCFPCETTFKNRPEYIRHRKTVHAHTFPCSECPKVLKTCKALQAHMKQHEDIPPYACELCEKTFKQKVHYEYHLKKHKNIRDYKCKVCGKAYIANSDLKVHMRFHDGVRPYICNICGKDYTLMAHLKMHLFTHKNKLECHLCSQKFCSPATLRMHIQSIHARIRQFVCELCERGFSRKHHLLAHYKVHERTAPIVYHNTFKPDNVY